MDGGQPFGAAPAFALGAIETRVGAAPFVLQKVAGLDQTPATPRRDFSSFPKWNYLAKVFRVHSTLLLELARKPCYQSFTHKIT
jgi:hypothetical protein